MEFDNTTILYIVFALIYFAFTNFVKKKRKAQNMQPSDQPEDATESLGPPPGRRPTFEELLEEFTTGKSVQREVPIEIVPVEEAIPSEDFIQKQEAEPKFIRASLKPQMEKSRRFDDQDLEESKFISLLREPDGPQKAFVLSEIFKKKY